MARKPPTKRCCLGMPGYGTVTAPAALGFFHASRGELKLGKTRYRMAVEKQFNGGSLLGQNFNALWCWAINMAQAGVKVDYFAMLHSDVEPEEFWLDKLIEEMERHELDVLGVVVPIKDENGMTSIALARQDGYSWRPQCRLTMKEIYDLPETFTEDDVGLPLLLNTGCWVCRFNPKWAKKVHFEINDCIRYDRRRKLYVAEVEPEDWNFSRQCHRLGLKLGVTRKVKLTHCGTFQFTNDHAWGVKTFDTEFVPESIVPLPPTKNASPVLQEAG